MLKAFKFDAVNESKYEVAYPYVDGPEDEGFAWFGVNRKAFEYKKVTRSNGKQATDYSRLDLGRTASGPGSRFQVPYREYMEALRPELVDNGFGKGSTNGGNANNTNNTRSSSRYQGSKGFIINKVYEGKVVGYNSSGKFAKVKLDDGGDASFYDAEHRYENRRVILRYTGRDAGDHDKWSRVD